MKNNKKVTQKPILKKVTVVKLDIQKMNMIRGGNNAGNPGESTRPECDITTITSTK